MDLGATKIFITGDILPPGQTEIFPRAGLQHEAIDFAFLPFAILAEEYQPGAVSHIDELIRPRHMVATHFRDVHRGASARFSRSVTSGPHTGASILYSARMVSMGSTRVPARAGTQLARAATPVRTASTAARVRGSRGPTP